jgi:hypothetical protein
MHNSKTKIEYVGFVDVAWIHPASVKVQWRPLLDKAMNLQIPYQNLSE